MPTAKWQLNAFFVMSNYNVSGNSLKRSFFERQGSGSSWVLPDEAIDTLLRDRNSIYGIISGGISNDISTTV
jgi:hypothetical protein